MHVALDQPAPALIEFERSVRRDPNRFRAVYGAALAAEGAGNRAVAKGHYARLQTLTADRDTERPELKRAKAFLAGAKDRSAYASLR